MDEQKTDRKKAKSKGFAVLGIPTGSTLTFRKDPSVTCITVDDKNRVEYDGNIYPISGLAKKLMQTPISGYHAFKYNGVLLAKLGDTPSGTAAVTPSVQKPAETPSVSTSTTVPLPAAASEINRPSSDTVDNSPGLDFNPLAETSEEYED